MLLEEGISVVSRGRLEEMEVAIRSVVLFILISKDSFIVR